MTSGSPKIVLAVCRRFVDTCSSGIDRQTDEWMEGWMDGWMDAWMDGWMEC